MKITQATFGVFHHFELARELHARGHLARIYSTFPWRRLEREGLPREKVESFPWVHTAQVLLDRNHLLTHGLKEIFAYRSATTFDRWLTGRIPECDVLIALSGSALAAGRLVQSRGGRFICDRGSTHRLFQAHLLREEYTRWRLPLPPDEPRERAREAEIYALADAIVVPSTSARQSFLDQGHDPATVHAIPYGVRLERFHKTAEPAEDSFEVLFVGALSVRKGIPYLLEGFAGFKHPRKRLRLIGSLDPALKPLLATLPQGSVEFLGPLPQADLVDYMSRSHVMVLPSIEEGLALVQGQALACGCPVIATTATGAEDLFSDGVEGFVVPIRSPGAITASLERLAAEPALRQRMSEAALARVQQMGGWHQYGDRWELLLQTLSS